MSGGFDFGGGGLYLARYRLHIDFCGLHSDPVGFDWGCGGLRIHGCGLDPARCGLYMEPCGLRFGAVGFDFGCGGLCMRPAWFS